MSATMPDLDARLGDALRTSARSPVDHDVMASVAAKRAHRRVVHRVQVGAVAMVSVLAVVAASFVVLDSGDEPTTRVAAPPAASDMPKVRVVGPNGSHAAEVHFVGLNEDEGYVTDPLLVQGDTVTAAAYDRDGDGYVFPPSRIIRFTLDGHVLDRIDLQGEIKSLTQGEGARWALTHDKEVLAPPDPEFRVKRIGAAGEPRSNAVPRGEVPAGELVAAGGAVWLPVTDGVLRFDPATGEFRAKIPLTTSSSRRAVAIVGKTTFVTDGAGLRLLDAGSAVAGEPQLLAPEPGAQYVDVVSEGSDAWALAETSGQQFVVWKFDSFGDRTLTETTRGTGAPVALELVDRNLWISATTDRGPVLHRDPFTAHLGAPLEIDAAVPVSADAIVFTRGGNIFRTRLR